MSNSDSDTVSLESGDVDFDSLNEWESDDSEISDDEGPHAPKSGKSKKKNRFEILFSKKERLFYYYRETQVINLIHA